MNSRAIMDTLKRIPIMGKIALSLAVLLLISMIAFTRKHKEGFTQSESFIMKEGPEVFDQFYSSVYDALVFNQVKNDFEIGEIINVTSPTTQSIILDIGSGTGHHVGKLIESGLIALGIDNSPSMIAKAKDNYPSGNFRLGSAEDSLLFESDSVTHILCLGMTIYSIKDKRSFFQNCFNWLVPGGYLALHLVNRDRFDPVLPVGNKLDIFAPQQFSTERVMDTRAKFDDFEYKGQFEIFPNDLARYKEIFIDDRSKVVRQNNHVYYMQPQKKILAEAQDCGFIQTAQIDLLNAGYDYQYVYILQKPN